MVKTTKFLFGVSLLALFYGIILNNLYLLVIAFICSFASHCLSIYTSNKV